MDAEQLKEGYKQFKKIILTKQREKKEKKLKIKEKLGKTKIFKFGKFEENLLKEEEELEEICTSKNKEKIKVRVEQKNEDSIGRVIIKNVIDEKPYDNPIDQLDNKPESPNIGNDFTFINGKTMDMEERIPMFSVDNSLNITADTCPHSLPEDEKPDIKDKADKIIKFNKKILENNKKIINEIYTKRKQNYNTRNELEQRFNYLASLIHLNPNTAMDIAELKYRESEKTRILEKLKELNVDEQKMQIIEQRMNKEIYYSQNKIDEWFDRLRRLDEEEQEVKRLEREREEMLKKLKEKEDEERKWKEEEEKKIKEEEEIKRREKEKQDAEDLLKKGIMKKKKKKKKKIEKSEEDH